MCPACAGDFLKTAIIKWARLDQIDFEFGSAVLEWMRLSLDAIQASPQMKKDASSKRDFALERAKQLQAAAAKDRKELAQYMIESDCRSIFEGQDLRTEE